MKKLFSALVILISAFCFSCSSTGEDEAELKSQAVSAASGLAKTMGAGWNLGNTLDANKESDEQMIPETSETSWGMPLTTKAMIDKIKASGFKTIRIPVSWHNHYADGKIDAAWLERVKEIVDWAVKDNGMYAIINIHHDTWSGTGTFWGYTIDGTHTTESENFVKSVWEQVATTFKEYDNKLIFETLNEPRLRGTSHEWWCSAYIQSNNCSECSAAVKKLNDLNRSAINAIRATGGNNATRLVMVPAYAASPDYAFKSDFVLPADSGKNTVLSVHMYTPNDFAMASPGTNKFTDSHKSTLQYYFNTLNSKFISNGIPVIIGEYGATNKNNLTERIEWFKYYVRESTKLGMVPCLWDNMQKTTSNGEEAFGYFDRNNLTWFFPGIKDAIIGAAK